MSHSNTSLRFFNKETSRRRVKYRGRADIVAEILTLAKDGTSKTKIMYGAYLSYVQIKDYLAVVINNGLLEQKGGKYHTTKKGLEFLKHYQSIGKFKFPSDKEK